TKRRSPIAPRYIPVSVSSTKLKPGADAVLPPARKGTTLLIALSTTVIFVTPPTWNDEPDVATWNAAWPPTESAMWSAPARYMPVSVSLANEYAGADAEP